jgi:hypothetical protein
MRKSLPIDCRSPKPDGAGRCKWCGRALRYVGQRGNYQHVAGEARVWPDPRPQVKPYHGWKIGGTHAMPVDGYVYTTATKGLKVVFGTGAGRHESIEDLKRKIDSITNRESVAGLKRKVALMKKALAAMRCGHNLPKNGFAAN